MTVEEFHKVRMPFYIDMDTLLVRTPTAKYMNESHAKWFSDCGIPYLHTVRGYRLETENDNYLMLYSNDFEIPNIICNAFIYLFDYFPDINWIGVGCHRGEPGEVWKPKLKIYRGDV
jgi:hypothetical protein